MIADYHLHLRDRQGGVAHTVGAVRPFVERAAERGVGELHEEAAGAIAAAGVAIEISTAGLRKPVGELYPDPALLAACASRAVSIRLASDAHEPDLVGEDFPLALGLARDAGYDRIAVFEARRRRGERLG